MSLDNIEFDLKIRESYATGTLILHLLLLWEKKVKRYLSFFVNHASYDS